MTPEEKLALEKAQKEAADAIKKQAEEAATKATNEANEAIKGSIDKFNDELKKAATIEAVEELKKSVNAEIAKLQASVKEVKQTSPMAVKTVNSEEALKSIITNAVKSNVDALKGYKGGFLSLDTTKAIDQTSFGVGGYAALTNERLPLYRNPYSPVYLRNIFPNIATGASNLTIWKQDATVGAAAIWARGTGVDGADVDKPNITPKWKKEVVEVDWIAGVIDVQREVLDDVDFMTTEIPYTLIYGPQGILAAENAMIMNYITNTAIPFALPVGFAALDNNFEEILAAAFGQMASNYITPTHILINNWDYLKYMAFNKAAGSGEYDQPNVDLKFVDNQLFINNLIAVPNPQVTAGEAYVIGADHSRYVSRQGLQMRVSEEHADNFTKNMVTYRAEVRGAFFTYNTNSIIKVTIP